VNPYSFGILPWSNCHRNFELCNFYFSVFD